MGRTKIKSKGNRRIWKIAGMLGFLFLGFGLMAYPFVSNYIYEHRQDSLIETYQKESDGMEEKQLEEELERAKEYNKAIFEDHVQLQDPFDSENKATSREEYTSILDIQGTGLMGYIKIPKINVDLPVYHGTATSVLERGIGHLEGRSLPIGGENTHAVLTGHTGLNRAKLFTDLVELKKGDKFFLYILNQKLAYEIDQIKVTLPEETEELGVQTGKDYCTLITCTPYGVNSHRLLVRGHRIPYEEESVEAETIDPETGEKEHTTSQWMRQYVKNLGIGMVVIFTMVGLNWIYDEIRQKMRRKRRTADNKEIRDGRKEKKA